MLLSTNTPGKKIRIKPHLIAVLGKPQNSNRLFGFHIPVKIAVYKYRGNNRGHRDFHRYVKTE
jgi:hypothetical protein